MLNVGQIPHATGMPDIKVEQIDTPVVFFHNEFMSDIQEGAGFVIPRTDILFTDNYV
jgi:hypothetical protein